MNVQEMALDFARYNLWANQRMIDWLLLQDPLKMEEKLQSSFDTVNKTLSHIWIAEKIWMCRIEGIGFGDLRTRHDEKDTKFIVDDLIQTSEWYIEHMLSWSDVNLEGYINYTFNSGEKTTSRLFDIIHHVFNHGTYHRGQLVTMGRALGFLDPPSTDFIHYKRSI